MQIKNIDAVFKESQWIVSIFGSKIYIMKAWKASGHLLFATGVIHNAVGILMGWPVLKTLFLEGLVNTVDTQFDRNAIFWFLFSGIMMMFAGRLMHTYIKATQAPVPKSYGYGLLAIAVVGCAIMPASGIWLAFPQAFIIIFADPKRTADDLNQR